MNKLVIPSELDEMLSDGREIAVVDVREHGEYGSRHLLFCTSIPFSRFEIDLPRLVPNPRARVVLYDEDGGAISQQAEAIAHELGYKHVARLQGGMQAWMCAGYGTYKGVHVPSKTLGELIEHTYDTPCVTAKELAEWQECDERIVVLDGRTWNEYQKMNIPDGISCPNGELAYRVNDVVPDSNVPIVVNCAGRTRSIIGCETLRQLGIENPIYALRNGTMGWRLAGLELEHGSHRRVGVEQPAGDVSKRRASALKMAARAGVRSESAEVVRAWLTDDSRTTFLLDVRDPREYCEAHLDGAVMAPGGQLIQATETFVGIRRARLVLVDDTEVRAAVCAFWLSQMDYDVAFLAGGAEAWWSTTQMQDDSQTVSDQWAQLISAKSLAAELAADQPPLLLDCRPGMDYREGHIAGAQWVIRPKLKRTVLNYDASIPVRLISDDYRVVDLVAKDLKRLGFRDIAVLDGGMSAWTMADLPMAVTPNFPTDEECVDYLFFVHDRHHGNLEAAKQYIAWEQGLASALSTSEQEHFTLVPPEPELGS